MKGIREVAVRLLKKFPKTHLILMEVTPYGPDPSAPLRKRQEEINELLRRLKLPRTTVLSINDRLLKPDGTFREGMFKDKVHLTAKGYQAWAEALRPLLQKKAEPFPARHGPQSLTFCREALWRRFQRFISVSRNSSR